MGKRKPNWAAFFIGLGLVLGPRIMVLDNFSELTMPENVGLLITDISGVALAWMSNGYSLKAFIQKRSDVVQPPANPTDGEQ